MICEGVINFDTVIDVRWHARIHNRVRDRPQAAQPEPNPAPAETLPKLPAEDCMAFFDRIVETIRVVDSTWRERYFKSPFFTQLVSITRQGQLRACCKNETSLKTPNKTLRQDIGAINRARDALGSLDLLSMYLFGASIPELVQLVANQGKAATELMMVLFGPKASEILRSSSIGDSLVREMLQLARVSVMNALATKDDLNISDASWNALHLAHFRTHHPLIPPLEFIRDARTMVNQATKEWIGLTHVRNAQGEPVGSRTAVASVVRIATLLASIMSMEPVPNQQRWKFGSDGRTMFGDAELLVAATPLNLGFVVQSVFSVFHLLAVHGKETIDTMEVLQEELWSEVTMVLENGVDVPLSDGTTRRVTVDGIYASDLKDIWLKTGLNYSDVNSPFCPFCEVREFSVLSVL